TRASAGKEQKKTENGGCFCHGDSRFEIQEHCFASRLPAHGAGVYAIVVRLLFDTAATVTFVSVMATILFVSPAKPRESPRRLPRNDRLSGGYFKSEAKPATLE